MATNTPDAGAHWRDSARTPRFFFMDSLAAFPLFIFILHIRLWTFFLALGIMLFLIILERFKFTIPVFFRWLRATLAGPIRVAKPWWRT
jgi:intracellular multiplication protein IcmT